MESLPPELLRSVLLASVHVCRSSKNDILPLRLVNKRFDFILREYIFKTVQLDFTKFTRGTTSPQLANLTGVGHLCEALYCDMMVIRDHAEISRLFQVFNSIIGKVPEMTVLLNSLRQYCMGKQTFDEKDFRRVMDGVLQVTPNMTRLKLNLPFQVIGRASYTATLLLATAFACFADRPLDFRPLETLVLDHVSDSTILDICKNPIDLGNALRALRFVKNLVISIKRQESNGPQMTTFATRLWHLISEAQQLESLCITGWNVKTGVSQRRQRTQVDFSDWMMKSLPYPELDSKRTLKHLRFLELKRIDIDPIAFERLIEQNCHSLKELYLNEVYLKVFQSVDNATALWIGHGNDVNKPAGCYWLADNLRDMESLKLNVLRVACLGYNDFDPDQENEDDDYDFIDPLGLDRSFEQRFVEAVLGRPPTPIEFTAVNHTACPRHIASEWSSTTPNFISSIQGTTSHTETQSTSNSPVASPSSSSPSSPSPSSPSPSSSSSSETGRPRGRKLRKLEYDVESFQRFHNTTSHWKCSIDGLFYNHHEKALVELQKIISVADRGMTLLSQEIDRLHSLTNIPEGGDQR